MEMSMRAQTYLRHLQPERKDDWFTVKPGTAAVAVAETTEFEVMQIAGEIHDMSVMDPADLLEMFEDYEDPNCEEDDWGIL
jgi:hypothetical protein